MSVFRQIPQRAQARRRLPDRTRLQSRAAPLPRHPPSHADCFVRPCCCVHLRRQNFLQATSATPSSIKAIRPTGGSSLPAEKTTPTSTSTATCNSLHDETLVLPAMQMVQNLRHLKRAQSRLAVHPNTHVIKTMPPNGAQRHPLNYQTKCRLKPVQTAFA